jgi:sugar phosphate isomerase/epimerase
MDRREFLATGAGLTATAAMSGTALAQAGARVPLGVQFFTFVGANGASMGWDKYSAALETVRKIGYDGVELAGLSGYAPAQIRKRADELGLALPSLHIGFDQVFGFLPPRPWTDPDTFSQAQDAVYTPVGVVQLARSMSGPARDLGCQFATVAAGGKINFQSLDNVMRFADGMNKANAIVREKGLTLSFHPHAPEFTPVQGKVPFEVLVANTDSSIRYEVDVYWAQLGGGSGNAVQVTQKFAPRIGLFHLKDMDKTPEHKIATPGDGMMDFAGIKKAAERSDHPWFFVERDGATDPVDTAARSYAYLRTLGFGLRA